MRFSRRIKILCQLTLRTRIFRLIHSSVHRGKRRSLAPRHRHVRFQQRTTTNDSFDSLFRLFHRLKSSDPWTIQKCQQSGPRRHIDSSPQAIHRQEVRCAEMSILLILHIVRRILICSQRVWNCCQVSVDRPPRPPAPPAYFDLHVALRSHA